jgi:hypothetical protein
MYMLVVAHIGYHGPGPGVLALLLL